MNTRRLVIYGEKYVHICAIDNKWGLSRDNGGKLGPIKATRGQVRAKQCNVERI